MLVIQFKKKKIITQILQKLKKILTDHDNDEYITTTEFNRLTEENFAAKLKQKEQ